MCGRYMLRKGLEKVSEKIGDYALASDTYGDVSHPGARYNIAPTQNNLILRKALGSPKNLQPAYLRWGLIPSWAKQSQTQSPIINVRCETVAEKPSFKAAFQRRRCLVPADGFFEWKKRKGSNLPYYFTLLDESIFMMAGIWETWVGEHGQTIESYTILTTHANTLLSKYHDRMPVILDESRISDWLESDLTRLGPAAYHELFAPIDSNRMTYRPANPMVNNDKSEGPECVEAPAEQPISQLDLGL